MQRPRGTRPLRTRPPRTTLALVAVLASLVMAGSADASSGFYIRGGGFGHGIGMGQYGALGYALHGYGYAAILNHYYTGTALGTTNPDQIVTVLLEVGSASLRGASAAAGKQLNPRSSYSVLQSGAGTLELQSSGRTVGPFKAPLVVSGQSPLDLAGVGLYRGSLEFWPAPGGALETVNALDVEDYVRGVVAGEMPSNWPAQALEAQAVAARTYALTVTPESSTFDVYPDTRSQMYGGVAAETSATDAAVAATRGQVVTYKGTAVLTPFFSSSGGYTESIQDAWPGSTPEPWLVGVPDPYDGAGGNPYHRWSDDLSVAQASATLGSFLKGSLIGIQPTRQDHTPRLVTAQVLGTGGRSTVTGEQLQQLFGLLSTYVSFTTITAAPGAGSSAQADGSADRRAAASPGSGAAGLVGAPPASRSGKLHLHGTVFPASAGARVVIQLLGRHGYHAIAVTSAAPSGAYEATVASPGRYRVVYDHIDGPAIDVTG